MGRASLWLCVVSSSFNIESFTVRAIDDTPTPSPPPEGDESNAFGGLPAIVPGTIQAENFDTGGEGVGYSDTDLPNNGGVSCSSCCRLELPLAPVVGFCHAIAEAMSGDLSPSYAR